MSLPHPTDRAAEHRPPDPQRPRAARLPPPPARIDWEPWLRTVERKRRALSRTGSYAAPPLPDDFFYDATRASFRLDGLSAGDDEVAGALSPGAAGKAFRSRQGQRIRNHVAVLRHVELLLRRERPLDPGAVVRWYTSISCGLSTARLDEHTLRRLGEVVTRVNSPQMRLRPALEDIAHLHQRLLAEPFVPAFNGILARLLLHYHLGRCGLPSVLFDPDRDRTPFPDEAALLKRLMDLVAAGYDRLLPA